MTGLDEIIELLDKVDAKLREKFKDFPNVSERNHLKDARDHVQKAITTLLNFKS